MRKYSFPPTNKQLFWAWIDKVLHRPSPSAYFNSGFKYKYAYDWLKDIRKAYKEVE